MFDANVDSSFLAAAIVTFVPIALRASIINFGPIEVGNVLAKTGSWGNAKADVIIPIKPVFKIVRRDSVRVRVGLCGVDAFVMPVVYIFASQRLMKMCVLFCKKTV